MSTFSSDRSIDGNVHSRHRSPRNERCRSQSPRRSCVTTKRVVIANIPYDVTWQKLKELFRKQRAEKAISTMHRFEIGDRKLVVREETARDIMRLSKMEVEGSLSGDSQSKLSSDLGVTNSLISTPSLNQFVMDGPITDSIYISNLDYSITWQNLKDLFKSAGRIINVVLKTDNDGKSRGVAVIKFSSALEAVQAVKIFNNQILKDRPMRIRIDRQGTPDSLCGAASQNQSYGKLNSVGMMTSQSVQNFTSVLASLLGLKTDGNANQQMNNVNNFVGEILKLMSSNNVPSLSTNDVNSMANLNALSQLFLPGSSLVTDGLNSAGMNRTNSQATSRSIPFNSNSNVVHQDSLQQFISAAGLGGMSQQQQLVNLLAVLGMMSQSNPSTVVDSSIQLQSQQQQQQQHQSLGLYEGFDDGFDNYGRAKFIHSSSESSDLRLTSNVPLNFGVRQHNHHHQIGGSVIDLCNNGSNNNSGTNNKTTYHKRSSRRGGEQRKLIVKNFSFALTAQDLKRMFRDVGEIIGCNMPTDSQGRSQGIAFLTFADDSCLERALNRFDGTMFQGRRLKVHIE